MFIRVILLRQLKECQGVPATAQDYESEPHNSTNISDLCVASEAATELLECDFCGNISGNATGKISKYTHSTGLPNQTFTMAVYIMVVHVSYVCWSCVLWSSRVSAVFYTCNKL